MNEQKIKWDELTNNICPFMSRMNDTSGLCVIQCLENKCMAWGEIDRPPGAFEGCKLIERPQ
jgi:hypothetical protein